MDELLYYGDHPYGLALSAGRKETREKPAPPGDPRWENPHPLLKSRRIKGPGSPWAPAPGGNPQSFQFGRRFGDIYRPEAAWPDAWSRPALGRSTLRPARARLPPSCEVTIPSGQRGPVEFFPPRPQSVAPSLRKNGNLAEKKTDEFFLFCPATVLKPRVFGRPRSF